MTMAAEQFEALVRKCEAHAKRDREGYARQVTVLALAGYGYVLLVLVGLGGTITLLVWSLRFHGATYRVLALTAPFVLLSRLVLRALRVRARRPDGVRVRRSDAPELFALIDRLARELHTPRLHRVLLTEDCNAALAQIPRLGPLGWYRNYLLLGLPELQARSPEELQPLLAHELGHLSRQHGRRGAWVYRIRATWMRLATMVEVQSQWGRPLFDWFLEHWWPYFNAHAFVLAREQEYEADRFAASIAGKETFARALGTSYVMGEFLSRRFWPAVYRSAEKHPEPPGDVLAALARALGTGPAPDDARRWLEAALCKRTGLVDTHPALAERLGALRIITRAAEPRRTTGPTAAEHYLGARLESLTAALERAWRKRAAGYWNDRHRRTTQRRARLRALTAVAADGDVEAAAHRRRAWDAGGLLHRAAAERRHVGMLDVLLPHDLVSEVVGRARERLVQMGSVRAAWLAKKKLAYLPESPLYVLGVVSSARVGWQDIGGIAARTRLPGQVLVAIAGPVMRWRLRRIPGARIL